MCKFRDLTKEEIDVRIGQIKYDNTVTLLLYKDARVDMNILDETVGSLNWQREHYECKGNLYCRVGIKDKDSKEWVWKSDCGTESNTEAEKGEASDSFKRACVCFGIGRELYSAPTIEVKSGNANIKTDTKNGKEIKKCYDKFSVEAIRIENKRITGLCIRNDTMNKRCFYYDENNGKNQ